jgi:predicted aspartyl protease
MIAPMTRSTLVILLVAACVAALPSAVAAQIYRYVDERGNSNYVEGLDNIPPQYRGRAVPLSLRNSPAAAAPPAAGVQPNGAAKPGALGGTTIRYVPGQRIMVDVRINGGTAATLLLDTGADRTLISPRALQAAGVSLTRPVGAGQMTGVTGTDQVQYVIVDSLAIGEARVGKMPVASYEMPGTQGDGLLGRDFLDQFKVNIDGSTGTVTLQPK